MKCYFCDFEIEKADPTCPDLYECKECPSLLGLNRVFSVIKSGKYTIAHIYTFRYHFRLRFDENCTDVGYGVMFQEPYTVLNGFPVDIYNALDWDKKLNNLKAFL